MIVQCCICKIVEGVKCPKCGEVMSELGKPQPIEVYMEQLYLCSNLDCAVPFTHVGPVSEVVTHGYCRPCLEKLMAKVPKRPNRAFEHYLQ